jgi:hypothetical protein
MIYLPPDVTSWLRSVFGKCNAAVSHQLSSVPFTHEPALDQLLISELNKAAVPTRLDSDWTVYIDTHFLGGRAMFYNWEIADIGLLAIFRDRGRIARVKVALLQSKRLYAEEQKQLDDLKPIYKLGFSHLLAGKPAFARVVRERSFHLTESCRYAELSRDSEQFKRIADYEAAKSIPVYYLLYNPASLPTTISLPSEAAVRRSSRPRVGARVIDSPSVRRICEQLREGQSPSYNLLADNLAAPFRARKNRCGWRFEHFVVDLFLDCHVGYRAAVKNDDNLYSVFFQRSGPISAAIAVTIDSPTGFDFTERALPEPREE